MVILTPGEVIGIEQLPLTIRAPHPAAPVAAAGPVSLAEMERLHIASILRQIGGKKMQAARLLGIDIKTLNKKIKDYGIPPHPVA
jgi:DNA-binding NtrC family response regulator